MQEISAICPACKEEIIVDYTPETGEVISCPQCGVSSEVIRTDPLLLQEIAAEDDFDTGDNYIG